MKSHKVTVSFSYDCSRRINVVVYCAEWTGSSECGGGRGGLGGGWPQTQLDHSFHPFTTSFMCRALCVTPSTELSPFVARDSSRPLSNVLHKFKNNIAIHFFSGPCANVR